MSSEAASESSTAWVWWLVAALVLALLIGGGTLLLRARSRRQAWANAYTGALAESQWLARDLLPALARSTTREQQVGGWTVAEPRVSALTGVLENLRATAPGELGSGRATALLGAVRAVSATLGTASTAAVGEGAPALDVSAASRQLDDALTTVQAAPGERGATGPDS